MPDSLPLIGITTYGRNADGYFTLPSAYVDIVRNNGGLPVLLPPGESNVENILELVDGLIMAGGGDLDPSLYGGEHHPSIERINKERDSFEILMAKRVLTMEKPVLGICRGMQILNVAGGGTLVEHLPERFGTSVSHRGEDHQPVPHSVQLSRGSRLRQVTGKGDLPVMSLHHQALGDIADSWSVAARSSDDVVEAIEKPDHPWMIAVLWHPELSMEQEEQRRLVRSFIEAAAKHQSMRQGM